MDAILPTEAKSTVARRLNRHYFSSCVPSHVTVQSDLLEDASGHVLGLQRRIRKEVHSLCRGGICVVTISTVLH